MALIICPECNGKVSDKAITCPHCGYPIENKVLHQNQEINYLCNINNKNIDFKKAVELIDLKKYKEAFLLIRETTNMSIKNCVNIINQIDSRKEVPLKYDIQKYNKNEESEAFKLLLSMENNYDEPKPQVQCPYCKSFNTSKITVGARVVDNALWGLFSTKRNKQWKCKDCGSEF